MGYCHVEDATARARDLLQKSMQPNRGRYSSQFYRVCRHRLRPDNCWQVKVKVRDREGKDWKFHKSFNSETAAAAVADVVALMVHHDPKRLNFDWSRGKNHLPEGITVADVFRWVFEAGMPIVRKPA